MRQAKIASAVIRLASIVLVVCKTFALRFVRLTSWSGGASALCRPRTRRVFRVFCLAGVGRKAGNPHKPMIPFAQDGHRRLVLGLAAMQEVGSLMSSKARK